jgi:hypothetical protein
LRRTVFVILNQTGPSLTLTPQSQVYVEVYNKFTEPGFEAKDNQGNVITNQVIINKMLILQKLGQLFLTYTVVDAFGMVICSKEQ